MANKLKCPQCGESDYTMEHKGGSTMSFVLCHSCGYTGSARAWQKQQMDSSPVLAQLSVGNNSDMASDKPKPECDPKILNSRNKDKKYRNDPKKRIQNNDVEFIRNVGSPGTASMKNPFIKCSRFLTTKDLLNFANNPSETLEKIKSESDDSLMDLYKSKGVNMALEEANKRQFSGSNPFVKKSNSFDEPMDWDANVYKEEENPEKKVIRDKVVDVIKKSPNFIKYLDVADQLADEVYAKIQQENTSDISLVIFNTLQMYDQNRRRFSMSNPFIRQSKSVNKQATSNPFVKKAWEMDEQDPKFVDTEGNQPQKPKKQQKIKFKKQKENLDEVAPDSFRDDPNRFYCDNTMMAKGNPFIKEAREYRRSPWGEKMKEISDNMVFPEGQQGYDGKGSANKGGTVEKGMNNGSGKRDPYTPLGETKFDTVDRKDYWRSPDPSDYVPGYKEWKDNQLDKFYDGWVEDHILNSGGKLIGSNTEKTMNLNDGERNHPPVYPTEAATEKLLESRHHFDSDYTTIVANNRSYLISKSAVETILQMAGDCPECKKKLQ